MQVRILLQRSDGFFGLPSCTSQRAHDTSPLHSVVAQENSGLKTSARTPSLWRRAGVERFGSEACSQNESNNKKNHHQKPRVVCWERFGIQQVANFKWQSNTYFPWNDAKSV